MPSFLTSTVPLWGQADRKGLLVGGGGQLLGLSGNHLPKRRAHFSTKEPYPTLPEPLEANCCTLNLYRSPAKCPGEDASQGGDGLVRRQAACTAKLPQL